MIIENALLYTFPATPARSTCLRLQNVDLGVTFLAVPRLVGFVAVFVVALVLWLIMTLH